MSRGSRDPTRGSCFRQVHPAQVPGSQGGLDPGSRHPAVGVGSGDSDPAASGWLTPLLAANLGLHQSAGEGSAGEGSAGAGSAGAGSAGAGSAAVGSMFAESVDAGSAEVGSAGVGTSSACFVDASQSSPAVVTSAARGEDAPVDAKESLPPSRPSCEGFVGLGRIYAPPRPSHRRSLSDTLAAAPPARPTLNTRLGTTTPPGRPARPAPP